MTQSDSRHDKIEDEALGGVWNHVLVSLCACILTVSIVGSIIFLSWRLYERRQLKRRVEIFVSSLENRTPAELADRATKLRERPKVARHVLPEIAKSIAWSPSEQQQRAAVEIARAFLDNENVEKALLKLRSDARESVAATAVEVLSGLQPPQHAADVLGRCLTDAQTGAAVDEACDGLLRLGDVGRLEMERHLSDLSTGRRMWLVGYVESVGGAHTDSWLKMLRRDPDDRVSTLAIEALARRTGVSLREGAAARRPLAVNGL